MSTEATEKGVYTIVMIKIFDNESRGVSLIPHVPSYCIFLNFIMSRRLKELPSEEREMFEEDALYVFPTWKDAKPILKKYLLQLSSPIVSIGWNKNLVMSTTLIGILTFLKPTRSAFVTGYVALQLCC